MLLMLVLSFLPDQKNGTNIKTRTETKEEKKDHQI